MSTSPTKGPLLALSFSGELRWLSQRIRPFLGWHAASFLCVTAGSLLALFTPFVLRWLIDVVIPQKNMGLLWIATVLMLLGQQGKTALMNAGNYLTLSAAQKMGLRLRVELLAHLDKLSADYYDETPVGAAMYPLKEPVEEIAYFGSDLLPSILRIGMTTSIALVAMFALSPVLTLAVLSLLPAFLISRQVFRSRLAVRADMVQVDRIAWNSFLEEHLSSLIPIQLLTQERRQERRAFRLLARGSRSLQAFFATSTWYTLWSSLAVVLAMCAVIAFGGMEVIRGRLSVGGMVAFYGFVTQLFEPLSSAADLYAKTQRALASVRQVKATLALEPSVTDPRLGTRLSHDRVPQVEFVGVEFAYRTHTNTLRIPALRISPGEQVAIAGENGAGKSTLTKLMARLYDPTRGSVFVGKEDLRNIPLDCLRRQVCYLGRDPALFDGTLASNLRFVRPAVSDDTIHDAVARVGLDALVRGFEGGLEQSVGPGGRQLSGGQRQRLALARVLLQQPSILILDEATCCLDAPSEIVVLNRIRERLDRSTLVVISHRWTTLAGFPRLLVLSGGQIVHDGNPSDLLTRTNDFPDVFSSTAQAINLKIQ